MKNVSIDDWDWCIDDESRLNPWFHIYREVEEKFTVKSDETTRVFHVQDSSQRSYFVKHITPNTIREHLIAFFSSKAKNIFESSLVLRSQEIPCANYPAWAKNGTESMLLSEEIPDTESALEYWFRSAAQDSAKRSEFVSILAALITKCVTASIVIPQISLDQILVRKDGSAMFIVNPLDVEKKGEPLSAEEKLPYLNPFIELRGEISQEDISIVLHEAGFSGNSMDIAEILHEQINAMEEEIENGNWPDYAAHVLDGEAGPLYRIVQKENSILRIRNTIWYAPIPEPDDSNSMLKNTTAEEAEKIWIDSFEAQLLRYHCREVPLSWEQFEDGRNLIRYALAFDEIYACGFNQ